MPYQLQDYLGTLRILLTLHCKSLSATALVLIFVVYNRRHESHIKYPGPDDDVRENIINYDDEGGGEDDMTAFDITPLQIPIGSTIPEAVQCKMPIMCKCQNKHELRPERSITG